MPDGKDWARLAAFLDGEGCIQVCIQRQKNVGTATKFPIYFLSIKIGNTDFRLMNWLFNTFGGKVDPMVNGKKRRKFFVWRVPADRRREILEGCMPYFILKSRQAEIGLKLLDLVHSHTNGNVGRTPDKVALQHELSVQLNGLNLTRGKNRQYVLPMVM